MSYVLDAQAQRMRALELGMYCLKFGLTKADLEEVLHIKRIKDSQNTYGGKKVPK